MPQIFISYAREDEAQVRDLYARLYALGFSLWMDKVDLKVGQRWRWEIPRQLRASAMVLVCFSRAAVAKVGYIRREFNLVLDILQGIPDDLIHTLPVLLEPCEVPEQFEEFNWCYLYEEDRFGRLVEGIRFGLTQRGLEDPTADRVLEPFFTNTIGMEFVLIRAGTFTMGSPDSDPYADDDEKPDHQVTISQPFYLGKYPVTQRQWESVMGGNPSRFNGDNLPVENVSWEDIQVFMQKLNEREAVDHYRLPTEAEWEYACRAVSNTVYYFGDEAAQLRDYAWYDENSDDQTHPIGQKKPNAWGLYDMHGNVWEWVQDLYERSPGERVDRGGSWCNSARHCRSAVRGHLTPDHRADDTGFRCAMSVPSKFQSQILTRLDHPPRQIA